MTVWNFKEWDIGPKNANKTQNFTNFCSLDFSDIYMMTGIQMKVKVTVFSFFRTTFIVPKEPLFGRFQAQNLHSHFLFNCFVFLGSLPLEQEVGPIFLHTCLNYKQTRATPPSKGNFTSALY